MSGPGSSRLERSSDTDSVASCPSAVERRLSAKTQLLEQPSDDPIDAGEARVGQGHVGTRRSQQPVSRPVGAKPAQTLGDRVRVRRDRGEPFPLFVRSACAESSSFDRTLSSSTIQATEPDGERYTRCVVSLTRQPVDPTVAASASHRQTIPIHAVPSFRRACSPLYEETASVRHRTRASRCAGRRRCCQLSAALV